MTSYGHSLSQPYYNPTIAHALASFSDLIRPFTIATHCRVRGWADCGDVSVTSYGHSLSQPALPQRRIDAGAVSVTSYGHSLSQPDVLDALAAQLRVSVTSYGHSLSQPPVQRALRQRATRFSDLIRPFTIATAGEALTVSVTIKGFSDLIRPFTIATCTLPHCVPLYTQVSVTSYGHSLSQPYEDDAESLFDDVGFSDLIRPFTIATP